jgi:hypothetical protein
MTLGYQAFHGEWARIGWLLEADFHVAAALQVHGVNEAHFG